MLKNIYGSYFVKITNFHGIFKKVITITVFFPIDEDQATISLSMDDLMQYAQPVPDNVITEENGLEDKLSGGSGTKGCFQVDML